MNTVLKNANQFITLLLLFFSSTVFAEHGNHLHTDDSLAPEKTVHGVENASCENRISVQVNGLVCDFCARAVEKVFGRRSEILGIDVDLDGGQIDIALYPGKMIDEATLKKLIIDSGYNIVSINKGC